VISTVERTVTLCAPGATPVNVVAAPKAPPSRLYSKAPVGAVMTIVPVGVAQVGCTVTEAVGAAGGVGAAFTVSGVGAETQVISVVDLTVTLCAPGATPVNVVAAPKAPPSRLYSNAPVGAVITMVPVGVAQVGCTVTEAVGAAGGVGAAFTVSGVGAETQVISTVERTVTLCAPGATPVNVVAAPKAPPSRLYSNAPVGAVITIVPVGVAQVG